RRAEHGHARAARKPRRANEPHVRRGRHGGAARKTAQAHAKTARAEMTHGKWLSVSRTHGPPGRETGSPCGPNRQLPKNGVRSQAVDGKGRASAARSPRRPQTQKTRAKAGV
ncbi:hypothetical protein ACRTBV_03165, partial [Burkholderia pseudomallei]|nr:hypothetical protein [Burkholderia mallei]